MVSKGGLGSKGPSSPLALQSCAAMPHSNHTLRFMSFPVSDISQAYRSAPERTEDVWQKVEASAGGWGRGGRRTAGDRGQPTFRTPTPPTPSSPDPVVLGEEQPLPDVPAGAGLQAAAGPGDQQRRASKRFPLGHMGHARGTPGSGVVG